MNHLNAYMYNLTSYVIQVHCAVLYSNCTVLKTHLSSNFYCGKGNVPVFLPDMQRNDRMCAARYRQGVQ